MSFRNLSNSNSSDYINGFPITGTPFDESVIIYHNGSFFYGTISSAGGISSIVSVGVGQSIIQSSSAGVVFLKSLLSGSPNITISSTANEVQFTMSGNLTNITSISGTTLALDSATITFPSTTTGTISNYLGLNSLGELCYNTLPTSVGSIANEGTGTGLVYDTTTLGVAKLRSILGDSNVQVSTSGGNIQTFLNPALTSMASISGSILDVNSSSVLNVNGTDIRFPNISTFPGAVYLGLTSGVTPKLCKVTIPASGITTLNTSGIGLSIVKSVVGSTATLKSINGTNSIDITDDTNTLTLALDPILNNITEIHTSGGNLLMDATTITWPNILPSSTVVNAVTIDGVNRLRYSNFYNSFPDVGGGMSLVEGTVGNALDLRTLNGSSNINLGVAGGLITFSTPTTLTDIRTVNSATSGNTVFGNNIILNGGQRFATIPPTAVSPPYYLVLDGSNNVNKIAPPSFTDTNIYNTDGTMTALNRTVSPFTPGDINNKVTWSNVVHSFVNSIRLNPTYLGTSAVGRDLNFVQFYDSLGDPWGKYEATNCETRVTTIPALGASGGYVYFYSSLANGAPAQLASWNLRVYIYENQVSNLTPWSATYEINTTSVDNTTTFQEVYPTSSQSNQSYILETVQAVATNQYTLALRLRNIGTTTMTATLTAKIESYTNADKTISIAQTVGNLVRTTTAQSLITSMPIYSMVTVGTNLTNSPPNLLWAYTEYPRLVKIIYFISAKGTSTNTNTTVTFFSNAVQVQQVQFRFGGTNNVVVSLSGVIYIEPWTGLANGALTTTGLNNLTITVSSGTNQDFTSCPYSLVMEFVK